MEAFIILLGSNAFIDLIYMFMSTGNINFNPIKPFHNT